DLRQRHARAGAAFAVGSSDADAAPGLLRRDRGSAADASGAGAPDLRLARSAAVHAAAAYGAVRPIGGVHQSRRSAAAITLASRTPRIRRLRALRMLVPSSPESCQSNA